MGQFPDRILTELRGARRPLLTLSILFFTIMLLEIDLGHRPVLAEQGSWLALLPVVWLPIALLALMAVQIKPTLMIAIVAQAVMAISAAIGMAGSGFHMMAAGVDRDHLSRVFSGAVWGGPVSPNWPVAITVASVLGFVAVSAAWRDGEAAPRDLAGITAGIANTLIIVGIASAVFPEFGMASATCLALAALLLLAALIGTLAGTTTERSAP